MDEKREKKTKEARTRYVLVEISNPQLLPSERDLRHIMTEALDAAGYPQCPVDSVVMVKDQCLTLNIELTDACKAIMEEHRDNP